MLSMLGKKSAVNILKYFSEFSLKTGFDNVHEMSNPAFARKNKKTITNVSSAENAHRVVNNKY